MLKCAAPGQKFQLDDDNNANEEPLTHMGTSLADMDFSSQVNASVCRNETLFPLCWRRGTTVLVLCTLTPNALQNINPQE